MLMRPLRTASQIIVKVFSNLPGWESEDCRMMGGTAPGVGAAHGLVSRYRELTGGQKKTGFPFGQAPTKR